MRKKACNDLSLSYGLFQAETGLFPDFLGLASFPVLPGRRRNVRSSLGTGTWIFVPSASCALKGFRRMAQYRRMTGMFNRSSVALLMLEMRGWVQPTFLAISDWDSPAPTRMDISVRATMLLLYRASDPATTSAESIESTSSSTVLPDRHSFLVDD